MTTEPSNADAPREPVSTTARVDLILAHQGRPAALIDLFVVFGLWLMAPIARYLCTDGDRLSTGRVDLTLYSFIVLHGLLAVSLIALVLSRRRHSWRSLGWTSRSFFREGLAAGVALAVILASQFAIAAIINTFWPEYLLRLAAHRAQVARIFAPMPAAMILPFAVFVGIYEETLFRGFLLTRLRTLLGNWTLAILVSSSAFALIHIYQDWLAILQIFFISLVLSALFVLRGSLLGPILVHAIFDLVMLIGAKYHRLLEELYQQLSNQMQHTAAIVIPF